MKHLSQKQKNKARVVYEKWESVASEAESLEAEASMLMDELWREFDILVDEPPTWIYRDK